MCFAGSRHTPDYLYLVSASECLSVSCVSAAVEQDEDKPLEGSFTSFLLLLCLLKFAKLMKFDHQKLLFEWN